jgi:predicted phage terminase large subunit-like protein
MPTAYEVERYRKLLEYELAIQDAQDRLLPFARFTMPNERFPDDPDKTMRLPGRHFDLMADFMERVERGEVKKGIINVPVRHGKTELCTWRTTAWMTGRNPEWDIIVATYGEEFAKDFATHVKDIINSTRYRQIFPDYYLVKEGAQQLTNNIGKNLFFLGRRSPTTGRGGNAILVDDPIKDDREVTYQAYRDDVWAWFTKTLLTRRHNDDARIVVTSSRWHEDDIIGRITDKTNPAYSKEFAEGWELLNLPALSEGDGDPLGRKAGEALWPERFKASYLKEMRSIDATAFSALYQGDPTPENGIFYQADGIHTYDRGELPEEGLKWFCASDHAVDLKQVSDPSCMGAFAVGQDGTAYVHWDLVWKRINTTDAVEEMLRLIRTYKPLWWYAEKGHISKAIGPFLKKRMEEEGLFCPIVEDPPVSDKMQRSQSARARAAQGKIRFPAFAPWWPRAKLELLKFPNGRHDDFVDFLSIIGMKLQTHVSGNVREKKNAPMPGSWAALKAEFARGDRAAEGRGGW